MAGFGGISGFGKPQGGFGLGAKQGIGKGKGMPGGLRRNKNTGPCSVGGPGKGLGGGRGRGKGRVS